VPELLINVLPVMAARFDAALPKAAPRPLAACDAGAHHAHAGVLAGSLGGGMTAGRALPRLPWTAVGSGVQARSGYQPISRTQFEQKTLINPVGTGGLGPHPAREPVPV